MAFALFCESVMFAPAIRENVDAETVAVAPLDVPPATEPMDIHMGCAVCAAVVGPMIVMALELACESVIFEPATKENVDAEAEAVTPLDVPPAIEPMDNHIGCLVWVEETEMEMEFAPVAREIPAPATRLTLEELPFREKFVAAGTVGP
jgi:hypothetical protein